MSRLFRVRSIVITLTLALAVLGGAGLHFTSAAELRERGCTPAEQLTAFEIRQEYRRHPLSVQGYLDGAASLLADSTETGHALSALIDEVMADNTLIFDASWQAEVEQCLDNQDAFFSQAQALHPPAEWAAYHDLIVDSFGFAADSADEWRAFFVDYDGTHLEKATDLLAKATAALEDADELMNGPDLSTTL